MTQAGRRRDLVVFGVSSFIDAVGTGTFLAGSALYFTTDVGLKPSQVGLGVTLSALLGLVLTVPWGHLAHRYGARGVYLVLLLSRAACLAAFATVDGFAGFLVVSCLLGTVDKPTAPVQQELVGAVTGGLDRQRVLAWVRTARNLGFVLGSGAAGTVSVLPGLGGYRAVVLINAATFVLAALLATTLPRPTARTGPAPGAPVRLTGLLADRRYLTLTAVNGVLAGHMALLGVGLPLWIVTRTTLPPIAVPVLTGVNAAMAMVFQIPVAARIRTTSSAARSLTLAGLLLAGCCVSAALLPAFEGAACMALAVLSMLLLTAAELVQSAGGWKLSFDLAPEYGRAVYLARFSLGVTLQLLVMPLLLTGLVFPAGAMGWVALAVALAATGVVSPRMLRMAPPAGMSAAAGARPLPGRYGTELRAVSQGSTPGDASRQGPA
ncbi:MFS transporter [Streptosporangium sp. CA-135522]|uniref:MFS transporter n=1 Tax=Streptosporangium sp. CA-135522 TaxID=3240072 RepID=UPI003D8C4CAA